MRRTSLLASALPATALAAGAVLALAGCMPEPGPTPAPSTTAATSSPSPTASPSPTTPPAPAPEGACAVDSLQVTAGESSVGAGNTTIPLVFTNTGSAACEIGGYPGVSFVGDGNGTEIGAPAERDSGVSPQTVSLAPGASGTALVNVAQAGNFPGCTVTPVDGFRIYPPNSYAAIFLPLSGLQGCAEQNIDVLTVQPVLPS